MIYSFVILCSLLAKPVAAQNVTVTVTPVQQILPPQAMLYMSNPDRYFTITLINNTQAVQNVYLGLSMEQTMPTSGLSLSTPPNRQPQKAIVLPPNQPVTLDVVAMKNLFNHIPKNEIRTSPGLISDYENGAFGLLPEGQYKAQITAYKWDPLLQNPVILSSPTGGICNFTICYKGQAPAVPHSGNERHLPERPLGGQGRQDHPAVHVATARRVVQFKCLAVHLRVPCG